jgi:hypothetical protein
LSVTFIVIDAVPAVVGVPEMTPLVLRVNPAGKVPETIVQVYGAVPPLAVSVWEYAAPTVPPVNVLVVILIVGLTGLLPLINA